MEKILEYEYLILGLIWLIAATSLTHRFNVTGNKVDLLTAVVQATLSAYYFARSDLTKLYNKYRVLTETTG